MSTNTWPGPTDGSWLMSPTTKSAARSGTALMSDKVMQIENDYEKKVYNGDIGAIDDVDSNSGELIARIDGRSVTYGCLASSTCWCPPTLRRSTKAKAQNIRRDHPGADPALRHVAAEPVLYRRHTRQEAGRTGRTEGGRHRGARRGRRRWSKLSEWLRPKPPVSRQFGAAS